ncbi:protein of unknown function [Marininema mesophilum]|uniref:DUF3899 domain-containing protein n=1 Tax=Marininema mesophilum TaxID=1048340 RepID=A0A1H2ZTT1_9BACL|nr:DUF3899 domain-containing protein [Marininema mesophilum]SDX20823.1 protein of unknown function [Marininema mesophilum]
MLNNRFLWIIVATLMSIFATWVLSDGSIIRWINALFMTGLISLVIAAAYFVINGGFFNNFAKGFSKIFTLMSNNALRSIVKDHEFDDSPDGEDSKVERKAWATQLIISLTFILGLVDIALSFLLLYFI